MICKICGTEETNNPDGICDNCKFCILDDKDISPIPERDFKITLLEREKVFISKHLLRY